MTRTKTFIIIAILLAFVSVFGAWTGSNNAETRYADSQLYSTYANETVSYTKKVTTAQNFTDGNCPFYYGTPDITNACGAVAGSEIVAFYDKYYPNMIPNWTSYYTASGKYRIQDSVYVPALTRELYTLMRTNVDDVGVSRTDFLNGLTSYINGKGYQVNYQSVKSGKTIDFAQCRNAIDNNKVIALFALPTTVYQLSEESNRDTYAGININSAHIMVVFGYVQIEYYNNSGLFRTDTYLYAAMGKAGYNYVLYKIDSTATEAAYIVNVQ